MAHTTKRNEHAGAKNRRGFHGRRAQAKAASKVGRRRDDRRAVAEGTESATDSAVADSPTDGRRRPGLLACLPL